MKSIALAASLCLFALIAGVPAAQADDKFAEIVNVPNNSNPPIPSGLKVTCLKGPNVLQPAMTCPVVKYKGYTTWAYSYVDNRVSMALVTYDKDNKVVRNVEMPGARYVWNATSSIQNQNVLFFGQSSQHVTAPWSALAGP